MSKDDKTSNEQNLLQAENQIDKEIKENAAKKIENFFNIDATNKEKIEFLGYLGK